MTRAINSSNHLLFVHGEPMRREWIGIGALPSRVKIHRLSDATGEQLVEPRSLSDADTVELTIFDFVTGYEIALDAMRLLPENYVLNIAGGCVPSTATIALWMQFTASYKLDDGPIASDIRRLRLSGVAALTPSGNR
jgi:hypothetical protein